MFDSNRPAPLAPLTQQPAQQLPARAKLSLSPTEKKVAALLLQRLTEQRIADHMQRSPNTVHVHVRNIYRKLSVHTRKELHEYPGIVSLIISKD